MSGPANEALKALGCVPVDVTGAEMYNALQTGLIDGVFYALASYSSFHLEEVCKYVVTNGLYATIAVNNMNLDWWNKLPKDLQDIVASEFDNLSIEGGAWYDEADSKALTKLKAANVTISDLSKEEAASWHIC
jgi:TRAP-type C4-dicarboxylate transport system substrate-binding protein